MKPRFRLLLALACACLLSACSSARTQPPVILAAASLQGTLDQVAAAWAKQGHRKPLISYAASSALARQIAGGAPADLFLSADRDWIDWLEKRNLLQKSSITDLLGNRLVIIAAPGVTRKVTLDTLTAALGNHKLALGDPQAVPAGRYARAALQKAGVWSAISAKIVPAENVRAALALVESGEAPYGIVYATDMMASHSVTQAGTIPARFQPKIVYPLALIAGSHSAGARAFAGFLKSPEAARIFERHGFSVLAK